MSVKKWFFMVLVVLLLVAAGCAAPAATEGDTPAGPSVPTAVTPADASEASEAALPQAVVPEDTSPQAVAEAFYTWYFAYIGDPRTEEFRNPLADRAYRDNPLLADSFEAEVDALAEEAGGFPYDPFLQAQDIPQAFTVEPGAAPDEALVNFRFGEETVYQVVARVEDGQIVAIERAEVAPEASAPRDWQVFEAAEYGFAFEYPAGWVSQGMAMSGPGVPEDWPVVGGWQLMPPDVYAAMSETLDTPPDPNAPPIVAPFQIEVVRGDRAALERVYPLAGEQTVSYRYAEATIVTMDPGYSLHIFAHPAQPDLWVVVTDWVTGFPGREALAEQAAAAREALLNSFAFSG